MLRVLGDGTDHELGARIQDVAVEPDGRVWVGKRQRVFELGKPMALQPADDGPGPLERIGVGTDGTLIIESRDGRTGGRCGLRLVPGIGDDARGRGAPHTRQPLPAAAPEATLLVSLSDAAVSKLRELTAEETNTDVGLRVYVYSGGCSGYRYGMMLEDQPTPEDVTVDSQGIKVYVDPQSTKLLTGAEIDYLDTLMGAGFTVNKPNAVSGCGCGTSFRTEEPAGSPGACNH